MKIIVADVCGHMGQIMWDVVAQAEDHSGIPVSFTYEDKPAEGIYQTVASVPEAADCIIDFSHHDGTAALCAAAVEKKLPLVIATTGQNEEEMAIIREAAKSIPVFCSGNMSMGIALLVRLARETAKAFPGADIEIVEIHHNRKIDAPSGTALMLANAIKDVRPEAEFVLGRSGQGKRQKQDIGISALRLANYVGTHEVIVATDSQIITLKHEAVSRKLFADGALAAAEWLVNQAPGLYAMPDMIG